LSDLVSIACWGQLLQRKLQEILKELFLESITAPVVTLLPKHALAIGLCFDTLLLRQVLDLADLPHTSQTTLQGKMLPSWQLLGSFMVEMCSCCQKSHLWKSFLSTLPLTENYHAHNTEFVLGHATQDTAET